MEEESRLEKISISGPTLASLLHRITSSVGDSSGLLFGHVTLHTPSSLSDDTSSTTTTTPLLTATITSFLFSHTLPSSLPLHPTRHQLLGSFSARRKSPLRPSMRDFSFTRSLSLSDSLSFPVQSNSDASLRFSPSIFLLLTTPVAEQVIHTHEYRAYQFMKNATAFHVRSVEVVNVGPGFRGQYNAFSVSNSSQEEEEELLSRMVGPQASGLEGVYEKLLGKIEDLARQVEISDAKLLQQENYNRKLRHKIAKGGNE